MTPTPKGTQMTTTKREPAATKRFTAASHLSADLAALDDMEASQLRERWRAITGSAAPKVRAPLLRLALAWEIQANAQGGLSRTTRQDLAKVAGGKDATLKLSPGTKLVREWKGVLHTVMVDDAGVLNWNGRQWNSTSAIARAITGTRWSGPRFFGLTPGVE